MCIRDRRSNIIIRIRDNNKQVFMYKNNLYKADRTYSCDYESSLCRRVCRKRRNPLRNIHLYKIEARYVRGQN